MMVVGLVVAFLLIFTLIPAALMLLALLLSGVIGIAIGVAGLLPVSDRRGVPDLFGRPLEITELGTADEIAAAASLLQGGAGEGSPIVHLRGAPFHPGDGHLADLMRPPELDLFR